MPRTPRGTLRTGSRNWAVPNPAVKNMTAKAPDDLNNNATTPQTQKAAAKNHNGNTNRSANKMPRTNSTNNRNKGPPKK